MILEKVMPRLREVLEKAKGKMGERSEVIITMTRRKMGMMTMLKMRQIFMSATLF